MPKLKPAEPPLDIIEQDFLEALKRLEDGEPTNRKLKSIRAKGALKITAINVALEAGRSRTLIAMNSCRYPRVREMIKQAKGGKTAAPTTYTQLIQRLRREIAEMKIQKERYQAEATAHYLARIKAEKEATREKEAAARLRKELAETGKINMLEIKK